MRFGDVTLDEARGGVLAHALKSEGLSLKKGAALDEPTLDALRQAGIERVTAAVPDPGDVDENTAALKLALACCGEGLEPRDTRTGRANLHGLAAGVLEIDKGTIDALNAVDEALTIATLPERAALNAGDMAATVKVIPYYASGGALERAITLVRAAGPPLRLRAYRRLSFRLIQTVLPATSPKMLDKTARITAERVAAVGSELLGEGRPEHDGAALQASIERALAEGCDVLLIAGASAVQDRRDTIPAAIEAAGGEILRFGMPVDPGNLLLLARIGDAHVVGLPGCARSPKPSGFDWVLQRLAAGLDVTPDVIGGMGVGGLLDEMPQRPHPRASTTDGRDEAANGSTATAGIVLAAGRSSRMRGANKLLMGVEGRPLVRRTAEACLEAGLSPVVVVTGHQAGEVEAALAGLDVTFARNDDYADGLASSLQVGVKAAHGAGAAAVVLGDMPGLTPALLRALVAAVDPDKGVRAAVPVHGGRRGNPVVWERAFFPALRSLGGDVGAKSLLRDFADQVAEVEWPDDSPLIDLDTPEAWAAYLEPVA